jgi:phosphohistidine phosphatase
MIIYFLRHASAGKKMLNGKKDEQRPLDEDGILQARYVGRLLSSLDVQAEQIVSSPLRRAMQTASLVANELAHEAPIRTDDALRPESDYLKFKEMLSRYRKYDSIMVVGHNPTESEFLSKIVSGNSGTAHIELKKGAVAKVETSGRNGVLEWLVTPKIARTVHSLKTISRPKTPRK